MNDAKPKPPRSGHSHMWVVGVGGLAVGAAMMIFLPQMKIAARSILLFAGFHVMGAIVLLYSAWGLGARRWFRGVVRPGAARGYDFGWGSTWMNGLTVAALVAQTATVAIELQWPSLWPLAFGAVGLAVVFLVGGRIMTGFRRDDQVVLPMVDLLRGERDVVLDAGCGSGRTSIALGRILRSGHVIAVDRFDAGYIDGGGRRQLERNLALAGLTDKVSIETADLTALPFDGGDFDAAVSTHVYDHLGDAKQTGLNEVYRVLKPGGRFLMAVWVPGWSMFAVANILSLFLTSKTRWRDMARRSGFSVRDEGVFNNAWFVLLEKPDAQSLGATA